MATSTFAIKDVQGTLKISVGPVDPNPSDTFSLTCTLGPNVENVDETTASAGYSGHVSSAYSGYDKNWVLRATWTNWILNDFSPGEYIQCSLTDSVNGVISQKNILASSDDSNTCYFVGHFKDSTPTYLETLDKLDQWSSAQYIPDVRNSGNKLNL